MAWQLTVAKPLSEPLLACCWFDLCQIWIKINQFSYKKKHLKIRSAKSQPTFIVLIEWISAYFPQAEVESESLLAMTNKKQFMQCYIPVLRQLDDCVDKLSKVQASLPDDGKEAAEGNRFRMNMIAGRFLEISLIILNDIIWLLRSLQENGFNFNISTVATHRWVIARKTLLHR